MEYSTQKTAEIPLEFDYLEYYYQDPFQNSTTSLFEAPLLEDLHDHEFNSPALPLPEDYNQIPHMGFQGLEDFSTWDFTALDITTAVSSPSHCDNHVLDEKPLPTMVDSFDYLDNVPSDSGHGEVSFKIESSGFSSSDCDSLVFDEKPLTTMVDSFTYLDNVPSDLGQHEVSMLIESCGFSSSHCDSVVFNEKPISTMAESFDNSNNVPSVLGHHEASMRTESATAFSSSHSNSLVLYEKPLSTIVDSFDYSDIPTPDLGHDEVSVMIENGFPSWDISDISRKRETSNRRRHNTQMKIKSDSLEFEEIKKYFDLPIAKAAKELKVGVTLLKRRCRELNIMRWPHRKIRSLNSLIETLKGMGLKNEVKMLEENKRLLQQVPNMELTKRTKKLRQSIFKANYNYKKQLSLLLG
ncbi:protein RKD3 [Rosa sericea]